MTETTERAHPVAAFPGGSPGRGRILRVLAGTLLTAASALAPAPATHSTPDGCGDLSNGRLCIAAPTGGHGVTVSYVRHRAGDVAVQLGYQRKDARITALPGWFGDGRTRAGRATVRATLDTAPGECIRAVMLYRTPAQTPQQYVTKWRCGGLSPG